MNCVICNQNLSIYNKTTKCYHHFEQDEIDAEDVLGKKIQGLKKGLGRLRKRKKSKLEWEAKHKEPV